MSTHPPHDRAQYDNHTTPGINTDPPPATELTPVTNTAATLELSQGECDAVLKALEAERDHLSGMDAYDGFVHDSFAFLRLKVQRACYREIELTGEEREFLQSSLTSLVSSGVVAPCVDGVIDRL